MCTQSEAAHTAQRLKEKGCTAFRAEEYDKAADFFTQALEEETGNTVLRAVIYANRAACMKQLYEVDKCLFDCEECLALQPDYAKAHMRKAWCLKEKKEYEKALKSINKAVTLDPGLSKQANEEKDQIIKLSTDADAQKIDALNEFKALGDQFLGLFGLSVNDFQAQRDNSGHFTLSIKK